MASLKKRGKVYYAQYYIGGKQKRVNLGTESLQVAKEKIRQLESSLYRGDAVPLPTKTPIAKVVTDYVEYMRCHKTARSVERDLYYLREAFGQICPVLQIKNRKISEKGKRTPTRNSTPPIEANCFEQITTADISSFIASKVRKQALCRSAIRFQHQDRHIRWGCLSWDVQPLPDRYDVQETAGGSDNAEVCRWGGGARSFRLTFGQQHHLYRRLFLSVPENG